MAGGRRNAKSSSKHHAHASDNRRTSEEPAQPPPLPTKHIPVPDLAPSSDFIFEINAFAFCLMAMAGQYINLYKRVFWLPFSSSEDALNYYLIDCNVLVISLIMVGRRLPVLLFKQISWFFLPTSYHSRCALYGRNGTILLLTPILVFCFYNIVIEHGILSIAFQIYPLFLYLLVFGPTTINFLELKYSTQEIVPKSKGKGSSYEKHSTAVGHVCSTSPKTIRQEVENLRKDFNSRMQQVLFNTVLVVYYASFLPFCFAPNVLYYEVSWITLHSIFTGLSCFTLYAFHCFPANYFDILHRSAIHLGHWKKMKPKGFLACSNWSESTLWNEGAIVKYHKEYFKAEGVTIAAEPGQSSQSRFYLLFKNPAILMNVLWISQLSILFAQMAVLFKSYTWNDLLSVELLILMNCNTLYGITKVYFVVKRIYSEEQILISKFKI